MNSLSKDNNNDFTRKIIRDAIVLVVILGLSFFLLLMGWLEMITP